MKRFDIPDALGPGLVQKPQEDPGRGHGIAVGTVSGMDRDPEVGGHGVQIPFAKFRCQPSGHLDGTEPGALRKLADGVSELGADESPVEGHVVGHEDPSIQPVEKVLGLQLLARNRCFPQNPLLVRVLRARERRMNSWGEKVSGRCRRSKPVTSSTRDTCW